MNNKRVKDVVKKVAVCAVAVGILVGGGYFSRTIVGQGTDQVATVLNDTDVRFENVPTPIAQAAAGTVEPTVNAQETDRKIKGNLVIEDRQFTNNGAAIDGAINYRIREYKNGVERAKVKDTQYFYGDVFNNKASFTSPITSVNGVERAKVKDTQYFYGDTVNNRIREYKHGVGNVKVEDTQYFYGEIVNNRYPCRGAANNN